MCDAIGHPVVRLRRVRIGPIADDRLPPGEFRELDQARSESLKTAAAERPRKRRRLVDPPRCLLADRCRDRAASADDT